MGIILFILIGLLAYLFYKKGVMDTQDNQKAKDRNQGFQSVYHKEYDNVACNFKYIVTSEFTKYELLNGSEKRRKIVSIGNNINELNEYFLAKMISANPYSINIKDIFIIVNKDTKFTFESNKTITMAVLFLLMLLYDGINKEWNILKDNDFKRLALDALNHYK